jgi:hypothetical protein
MKLVSFRYLLLVATLISLNVNAEIISFACTGTGFLTGVGSSPENINVTVDTSNGEMWGYQGGLVPGCRSDGVFRSNVHKCSINDAEAFCSCSNQLGASSISLSRITGELRTHTDILEKSSKGKVMSGRYLCKRVAQKTF